VSGLILRRENYRPRWRTRRISPSMKRDILTCPAGGEGRSAGWQAVGSARGPGNSPRLPGAGAGGAGPWTTGRVCRAYLLYLPHAAPRDCRAAVRSCSRALPRLGHRGHGPAPGVLESLRAGVPDAKGPRGSFGKLGPRPHRSTPVRPCTRCTARRASASVPPALAGGAIPVSGDVVSRLACRGNEVSRRSCAVERDVSRPDVTKLTSWLTRSRACAW
jgi:hypothetical protein